MYDPLIHCSAIRRLAKASKGCTRRQESRYAGRRVGSGDGPRERCPPRAHGAGRLQHYCSAIADDEFQFLVTADARLGTFAHYAEQALVVFKDGLIEQVANGLDQLLGGGVRTSG